MSFTKWDNHSSHTGYLSLKESVDNGRAAAAARDAAELDRRQAQLVQMRSEKNSASERIRIWEAHHGLALPRSPAHPLLKDIAEVTSLTLEDVRSEQCARLGAN